MYETEVGVFFAEVAWRKARNRISRYETEYLVQRRTGTNVNELLWAALRVYERF